MKVARFFIKCFFILSLILSLLIFGAVIYLDNNLTKEFKIKKGDVLDLNTKIPVTAEYDGAELTGKSNFDTVGKQYSVDIKAFGIFPVSKASVEVVDEMYVVVLGTPFGMKLYTEGVLVVDTADVETENGAVNPATKSGIKKGDYIVSVNNREIHSNEDLSAIVEHSGGEKLHFVIMRNGKKIHINVTPVISNDGGIYKIGIWIKDSSAGIGTLTFYSPATDVICGLGHGICDDETGTLLSVESGEIVDADIISAEKGEAGSPGKLNGRLGLNTLGEIGLNCEMGVYSKLVGNIDMSRTAEIALKQEVKDGKAQILCTVEDRPTLYDCEIKIRNSAFHSKTQNIIVTVTDEDLLNKTGGIIQGLSGSPLLQNGKLIGAVTHVLVDDPTKGYAIFAENMLETAQSLSNNVGDDAHIVPKKDAS